MVDFSNDSTVAAPPSALLKILVIEQRDNVIQALRKYRMLEIDDVTPPPSRLCAEVESLYYNVCDIIARKAKKPEDVIELEEKALSGDPEKAIEAFRLIGVILDRLKLTAWDTRSEYDKTDPEAENEFYTTGG